MTASDGIFLRQAPDDKTGLDCVFREALTPEAAERLKAEARVVGQLEHPGLPRWVRLSEEGGRVTAVREAPQAETLAAVSKSRALSAVEAAAVAREAAETLRYLHAFFPPIPHGRLDGEHIALGAGERTWLLDPAGTGSPDEDLRSLRSSLLSACSPEAVAALSPVWPEENLPASAAELLRRLSSLKLKPPTLISREPPVSWRWLLGRGAVLASTLAVAFGVTLKIRFEYYPEWSTRSNWAESLKLSKEFGCDRDGPKPPPVVSAENILENPGLEGPCGWRGRPILRRHVMREDSHGGRYHIALGPKEWVTQDIDLAGLENRGEPGCCDVTVRGWMRGGAAAGFELVAVTGNSESHLGGGGFNGSERWTQLSENSSLPSGARKLRLYLDGNRSGKWFSRTHFDDFEVILHRR